ncbi:hypothetical protein [Tolypothrix sp. VBCCA 56010]|uniref:hypothetical protein n=1 Tax=Tolypothrix sp. VBCCA 56010 TaxID=3137731 RepID=UPI003D7CAAA8
MNTAGTPGNGSARPPGYAKPKGKKKFTIITLLMWIITALIGWAIFTNIKPYEVLATRFLIGVSYQSLGNFLTSIPFLGGIFKLIWSLLGLGMGTLLWAFFQILELLPLALFGHSAFLDNSIARAGGKKYNTLENDHWEVKVAKTVGNSLSTEVLRFLILLGIAVYVVDFFLCLYIFPPVKGGTIADLFKVLYTGQFGKLDWGNIFVALITVTAVELLFKLRSILKKVADDING